MPAPKGHPRYGGRTKGTPNVDRKELIERAKKHGVDFWDSLCKLVKELEHEPENRSLYLTALKEGLSYVQPKLKLLEVTGEGGGPVQMQAVAATDKERQALIDKARKEQNA